MKITHPVHRSIPRCNHVYYEVAFNLQLVSYIANNQLICLKLSFREDVYTVVISTLRPKIGQASQEYMT